MTQSNIEPQGDVWRRIVEALTSELPQEPITISVHFTSRDLARSVVTDLAWNGEDWMGKRLGKRCRWVDRHDPV